MEWKWSTGEKYERSLRPPTRLERERARTGEKGGHEENQQFIENKAQQQSLLSENDVWGLEDTIGEFISVNKREETYNKMSEREMVCQVGQNPFMPNSNYLDDVIAHEQFLKPINSSMEREKHSSSAI